MSHLAQNSPGQSSTRRDALFSSSASSSGRADVYPLFPPNAWLPDGNPAFSHDQSQTVDPFSASHNATWAFPEITPTARPLRIHSLDVPSSSRLPAPGLSVRPPLSVPPLILTHPYIRSDPPPHHARTHLHASTNRTASGPSSRASIHRLAPCRRPRGGPLH